MKGLKASLKTIAMTLVMLCAISAQGVTRDAGGDMSLLLRYEDNGANYKDKNGTNITDVLAFVKTQGWTSIRVRLFVDPSQASTAEKGEGVCQDLEYVKRLGAKIKAHGLKFMLDFHYSDSWADPLKQYTPASWASLSEDELKVKIYDYTKSSLQALKAANATPDFIQIGNEESYGILWGVKGGTLQKCNASSGATEWARFSGLLSQASKACREVCPKAKIIIHHDRACEQGTLFNYYRKVADNKVDYDVIGLSYYPHFQGYLPTLDQCLTMLGNSFGDKEVMIVECGYYHKWFPSDVNYDYSSTYPITHAGQEAFTKALIETLMKHDNVTGLYWWWPEANEFGLDWNTKRVTNAWYNAGLWDNETGRALPALYALHLFSYPSGVEDLVMQEEKGPVRVFTIDGRYVTTAADEEAAKATLNSGLYIIGGKKVLVK
ncbi:MAG: glycosyl hydrolase 53 family protein [Muribaculaceae bacterium]|nr:glycosyl hydrolase 53 family protein [Muribaculaceae bacterium]